MPRPLGVVFDFDGVIAASMQQHVAAYRAVLAPLGVAVADDEVLIREGARSESTLQDLLAAAGIGAPDGIEALADAKQEAFRSLGDPPMYAGAIQIVERVAARVPVGLVTGTRRANLERLIPDLLPRFAAVMSQESYTHDKPHPEPFARAAQAMDLPPADLVAVENAPPGIESARAAGYGTVIGIATTLAPEALEAADRVVKSHKELESWLSGCFD